MASTIWRGTVSFGLVNIPVGVYTAVREEKVHFKMLRGRDMCPVKYKRVCEAGKGEEVPWKDIVKGFEYQKGKYIVLEDSDFEQAASALPTSKTLEIESFVKEEDVDPRFFDRPYFLIPTGEGAKAYALLREAMREAGTVAVGTITMRQKHYLAAIKVLEEALVLEIMRFANELVDIKEFTFPSAKDVRPQELTMARQLVENLTTEFHPEKHKDEYQVNLRRIIDGKLKGKKVDLEEAVEPEPTGVIDLMERLQQSLEQGNAKPKRKAPSKRRKSA